LKKILILTADFGEGEQVAARNLRQALEHLGETEMRVEILDLLDSCYGRFHALLGHGSYGFFDGGGEGMTESLVRLREALRDVLRSQKPDAVISTCPLYGILMTEMERGGRTRDFTLISLVLHLRQGDSPWSKIESDFFVVTNARSAEVLVAAGITEEKIKIFGFPVQPFISRGGEKKLRDLGEETRPRVLYLMNSARKKAPKLLDRFLKQTDWDLTVCVDGETDLEEMARACAAVAPGRMEVIGHVRDLPQLLRRHHVVISRAETGVVQEAIAARCPLIAPKLGSGMEGANLALLKQANAGALAEKPREVIDWLERAFRDQGGLLALWRKNLESLGQTDGAMPLAHFVLRQIALQTEVPLLRALPAAGVDEATARVEGEGQNLLHRPHLYRAPKKLLMCDFHTHTTWSDGKLTVPEMVDFYGQRGFDCLCITDHLCDPNRLLGRLVNLTGLVIPPDEVAAYFESIEREKKRAWAKYDLILMAGVEFNKDGYTAKTSTHLLGVDLKHPIDASLEIKGLIAEIHAQGALAIASHPHEMKSHWGRDTLYLWEHVDEYAPLIDAWEVANRDDIFNPVGLKKLPFVANSDFHKPKHIHSWKTMLYCEKETEAIKHCIRVNRDVSITLYRDHRFGLEERCQPEPEGIYRPAPTFQLG